ncbi:hypothetical protein FOS14_23450 [Skermania sp. ID1734]|uniref:type IV secretory system conjugative DNA transfer family protein n=1 Tax=Skermania sp. ID1734 TaxID=2597516 RepID=UPI00117E6BAA|nr:TraM recognition domain-containing protein [Skermania sp. ID1734]TSD93257.1 hypothetical protein FOS14_23450 [Skermania sp. ID1734]
MTAPLRRDPAAAPPAPRPLFDPVLASLWGLALLVVVALVCGAAISGWLAGHGLAWPHGLAATFTGWITHPGDPAAGWPADPRPGPAVSVYGCAAALAAVVLVAWMWCWIVFGARRDRARRYPGLARTRQVAGVLDEAGGKAEALRTRPSLAEYRLRDLPAAELVAPLGLNAIDGKPIVLQNKDSVLVIGSTGSGKSWRVAAGKIDTAPGACVVSSTRGDLLAATYLTRAAKGYMAVFDPENVTGWPRRTRWSLIAGCENPDTAARRATALASARPVSSTSDNGAWFTRRATVILRSYLRAAAVSGATLADVAAWASDPRASKQVARILGERDPVWAAAFATATNSGDARTDGNVRSTVEDILDPLSSPTLLAAVDADSADSFDVTRFVTDGAGTLFVISDGGNGSVAPFAAALVNECHYVGYRAAARRPARRLDPPLRMVLDEAMNVAAVPELGKKMTDSGGVGINLWVFVHNINQIRKRLSTTEAADLIGSATARLILPGLLSDHDLKEASNLLGTITDWRASHSEHGLSHSQAERPVLSVDEIRRLRYDEGLLIYRNQPGVLLRLPAYWDGGDGADTTARSIRLCENVTEVAARVEAAAAETERVTTERGRLARRLATIDLDSPEFAGLEGDVEALQAAAALAEAEATAADTELMDALDALDTEVADLSIRSVMSTRRGRKVWP